MTTFKDEITELIEDEIIGRYFYEDGAIKWTIKTDEQVMKAFEILNNKEKYSSILNGKSGLIINLNFHPPAKGGRKATSSLFLSSASSLISSLLSDTVEYIMNNFRKIICNSLF